MLTAHSILPTDAGIGGRRDWPFTQKLWSGSPNFAKPVVKTVETRLLVGRVIGMSRGRIWARINRSFVSCIRQVPLRLENRYDSLRKCVRSLLDVSPCDVSIRDDLGESFDMLRSALIDSRLKIGAEPSRGAHFPQIAPRQQNVLKRHAVLMSHATGSLSTRQTI